MGVMNTPAVLKFGGASVKTPAQFHVIAQLIADKLKQWPRLVVVVSAMGDTTDQLLKLAREVHPEPPSRELDMLVSVGERISIALLAMALKRVGVEAVSFTGSQSGILTTGDHTEARIVEVKPKRILAALDAGKVAIVAGFQGMSKAGEITTLGRGGSDTTAVALAVGLGAEEVVFFKDVDGIYDRDPKKGPARRLARLSFAEALEMTAQGAKVLCNRSVALAAKNGVKLRVVPFAGTGEGSLVGEGSRGEEVYEC